MPIIHRRGVYGALRDRVEAVHGCRFDDYVLGCTPTFPWGFSEFNALGQIALTPQWREHCHVIDTSAERPPSSKVRQFSSHGGFEGRKYLPSGDGECAADLFRRLGL